MIKLISFTFSLAASFRFLFQSTDPWFLHGIYLRYETVLFFKLLQKHTFQLQYKTKSFAWFWNEFSNFNENWCISNTKIHILPDFKSSQKVGESSYKVRKNFSWTQRSRPFKRTNSCHHTTSEKKVTLIFRKISSAT